MDNYIVVSRVTSREGLMILISDETTKISILHLMLFMRKYSVIFDSIIINIIHLHRSSFALLFTKEESLFSVLELSNPITELIYDVTWYESHDSVVASAVKMLKRWWRVKEDLKQSATHERSERVFT
ncbi:hypothetical protein MTR_8g101700 [Medicago truncatula]|uniref:Uncharacterized protein n=1 Tax=Medicago truncatula TaxID=3880 RepID=G7LJK7_MEDTR|nr:hypothetical protein MTR_8g101700 [Medicago truncatula]